MKLPTQKKIMKEDMKGAPEYMDPVVGTVNSFMESTYQALNKNITFQENIASFIKEINYTTNAAYPGTPNEPVKFQNQLKTRPIGLLAIQVYDKATYTPVSIAGSVPWIEDNSGSIVIHNLPGLEASKTYVVRFLIF